MLKKLRLIAAALITSVSCVPIAAQNLISHGNFEASSQPVRYQQISGNGNFNAATFATGWQSPTGGSPDYFDNGNTNPYVCGNVYSTVDNPQHKCCYPQVCTWRNIFGSQEPRDHSFDPDWSSDPINDNYVGLSPGAEYIQQALAAPLTGGVTYELTFWVSAGDLSPFSFRMQALFSYQPLTDLNNGSFMNYSSDPTAYVVTASNFADDKEGWTKVTMSFTATGDERYVTLGVFSNSIYNPTSQSTEFLSATLSTVGDCIAGSGPNGCGGDVPYPNLTWTDNTGTHIACTNNTPNLLCQAAGTHYLYIDDVFLRAICVGFNNPVDYLNATLNSSNSATNTNILLTGNITISGNVSFAGCTIRCNPGTYITVPSGSSLQLSNGTSLSGGCNNLMWYGIKVNSGGSLTINSASIEDAILGVDCNAGFLSINRGTFRKNVDCVKWQNPTSTSGQFIKSSTFDMEPLLVDQSQGVNNGHSRFGVRYINASLTTPMQIGGTGLGEGCVFTGGLFAIVADRASLNVVKCRFSKTVETAVDFRGDASFVLVKDLKIIGCTFKDSKQHVKSYFNSNLTIESSSFTEASQHSVLWFYNPDCHLKIGDDTDPNKGNVFTNNGWTAVVTSGNTTSMTNKTLLANPNNYGYWTTMIISNNKVNGPAWATGFFVTENALGSNISYQSLSISKNVMTGLNEGILVSNVRGWGGAFTQGNEPQGMPSTMISENQILASTVLVATATCIKVDNAPGLNITKNGLDSDNNQDWQNTGIRADNSEHTEIEGNFVGAGRGIIAGGSMLWSNIHCNTLVANEVGIVIGWCALRPSAGNLHGSNIESYPNNFVLSPAWHTDIHDYYSSIPMNQWVWSNSVSPTYPSVWYDGVTGGANQSGINTSIISLLEGPFVCPGDPYRKPAPAGPNVNSNVSDPDLQWRYDYNYQVVKNNTNQGSNNIASQNIKRIIKIENAINSGDYSLASAQMNGFNPTNLIEQNYKTVLQIMLDINSPTRRDLNATEISALTQIAEQNPRTSGASVTLARGILRFQLNMKFKDEEYATEDRVKGTAFIQTPCCLAPASGTRLTFADQFGNYLPISPALVDQDGNFSFDPYQMRYYNDLNPGTLFRIAAAPGSKFTVLNKDFKTLSDWILASPIEIILGGVKEDYVVTSPNPNAAISSNSTATDVDGNTYSVGTVNSSNGSDFLVEKRNLSGNIVWSRSYNGVASGNDSATCISIGSDGNVYVAGKSWNGNHYNFAAVKYDTTGFMQWEVILHDSLTNDIPTGICFHASDTSVSVTGTCCNSNQTHYKTVKYKQCIDGPSNARYSNVPAPERPVTKMINYYPNPSAGTITIDTKGVNCTLSLYNIEGQIVWTKGDVGNGSVEFPENQVPDGVYLCKFTTVDGQTQFEKLIIQRH